MSKSKKIAVKPYVPHFNLVDAEKELIMEKTAFVRSATRLLGAITEAFITFVTPEAIKALNRKK